jgi:phosphoglycolate phosphatase
MAVHSPYFGDGYVEIEEGKKIGALAVGVASNEAEGGIDEWKKERLLRAGADMIVPDFADVGPILAVLAK